MHIFSRSELSEFRRRYRWMRIFVILIFVVLIGRLVQLQLLDGNEHYLKSLSNIIRTVPIPAVRGQIFDNKGRVIATSKPSHTVNVIPHYFDMGKGFEQLVNYLGFDDEQSAALRMAISERLSNSKDMRRFEQITVADGISREQLSKIKAHQNELPGVDIVDVPLRYYPYGGIAGHIIGYMNEVNNLDIEKLSGTMEDDYRSGDKIGRTGIEYAFEKHLRGVRGWRKKLVDARGLALSGIESKELLPEPSIQPPRLGNDITLTVDMALQKIVDRALRGHPSGAVVVMDVKNGRVLAATSKPVYDLNLITMGLSFEEHKALNENPFRPRIDKTVYENYFPGSVFKPFTAMSALEEGKISEEDVFHCSGFHEFGKRTFRCPKPHGDINLKKGLTVSCNVLFFKLAEMTGMDTIARYAREFGFGKPTGIGYNDEASGFIPTKRWYTDKVPGRFKIGYTLNAAIGQGNVKVTLMQVAAAYSAIANGGTIFRPQVIRKIENSSGDLVKDFNSEIIRKVAVSSHSMDLVVEGMKGVVSDDEGTAHNIYSDEIQIAGKTGTAQVPHKAQKSGDDLSKYYYMNRDHAWFAAIAPADDPQIAVVTLIEHGGAGGDHAAPVAREIIDRYFKDIVDKPSMPLIADKNNKKSKRAKNVLDEQGSTTASTFKR